MGFALSGRGRLEQGWPRKREKVWTHRVLLLIPHTGLESSRKVHPWAWILGKVSLGRSVLPRAATDLSRVVLSEPLQQDQNSINPFS